MVLGMARGSLTLTGAARRSFAIPVLPPSSVVSAVPRGVSAQDVPRDSCPPCHLFAGSQTGWRPSCSAGGGMWGDTDSTGRRSHGLDGPRRRWQELCCGLPRHQPGFGQWMEVFHPHPIAAVWSQMQQSRLHPLDPLVQPAQTQHPGQGPTGVFCAASSPLALMGITVPYTRGAKRAANTARVHLPVGTVSHMGPRAERGRGDRSCPGLAAGLNASGGAELAPASL